MSSDLSTIRADLKTRLAGALPPRTRIEDALSEAIDTVVPVVYFEFTEVSSAVNGSPLDRFTVAPRIDVIIASAGAGDEDGADELALSLARALQSFDDVWWDTAKKERLSNGALAWRFALTIISTIQTPAPAGPEPEEA